MLTPQKGQVMFRLQGGDTVELVSQLLQGTFPNYDQLIPQSYTTRAILDSQATLRATRTAAIFARDGSNIIRMHVMPNEGEDESSGGRLLISARSEEVGDDQDEVDVAELEGEEGKIAFNSRYLLDVLSVHGPGTGSHRDHHILQPRRLQAHRQRRLRSRGDADVCPVVNSDGSITPVTNTLRPLPTRRMPRSLSRRFRASVSSSDRPFR